MNTIKRLFNTLFKKSLNKTISNIETILLAMKKYRQEEVFDRCYALHYYPNEGYRVLSKEEYIREFGREIEE